MGATACVRPEKIGCRMRAAVIVVLLSAVIFEASLAAVPEFEADEFEAFNGNTELVADYKPKAKHSPKKAKCEAEKKVKAAAEQKLKNMRTGKAERERKVKCEKADKAAEKQRKGKAAKKENEKKAKEKKAKAAENEKK